MAEDEGRGSDGTRVANTVSWFNVWQVTVEEDSYAARWPMMNVIGAPTQEARNQIWDIVRRNIRSSVMFVRE